MRNKKEADPQVRRLIITWAFCRCSGSPVVRYSWWLTPSDGVGGGDETAWVVGRERRQVRGRLHPGGGVGWGGVRGGRASLRGRGSGVHGVSVWWFFPVCLCSSCFLCWQRENSKKQKQNLPDWFGGPVFWVLWCCAHMTQHKNLITSGRAFHIGISRVRTTSNNSSSHFI